MTAETGPGDGTIRILHIDDDPQLVELAAELLRREDDRFECLTETDPHEALAHLSETAFDCVVCDYDMPGMDGLEFLEAVREDHPDLPFILFTGKGPRRSRAKRSRPASPATCKRRGTSVSTRCSGTES